MAIADWAPTVDDVATGVPSRAKGEWGGVGRFDSTTRPSADQVQRRINLVVSSMASRIGRTLPTPELNDWAKEVASIRVSMLIELNLFPEQIDTRQSPYRELKELWEEEWRSLQDAVIDARQDDDPDDGANVGPGGNPMGWFDNDELIGMQSEW